RLRSSRITVTTMRVIDMSRSLSSSWAINLRRPSRRFDTPSYTATTEGASMRNTLATPACIVASSQRPSLASCCASAQAWNRPARASTRSSFMPKVSNTGLRFPVVGWIGTRACRQQATVGCIGGHDHGTAEADVASIEDYRLSRGHGALGIIEAYLNPVCADAYVAGLVGLAVTGARGAAKLVCRRGTGNPVGWLGAQPPGMQPAVLAALRDIQDIRRHVLAHHEPRFAAGALPAADAEAVALAQGVIHDALVLADQRPVGRAHFPRTGRDVLRQEAAEIALADEADPGGILLRMCRQRRMAGKLAHLRFVDGTQWEQRGSQRPLAQRVQEIALVLVGIQRAQQAVSALDTIDARVVAGGDLFGAQRTCFVEKGLELDLAVAQHVGVGRATRAVFGQEMLEHAVPVFRREIARVERDAEPAAHGDGVLAVDVAGAGAVTVVFLPVLHEQAFDLMTGPLQQQRGHRRIDAPGDAQHHLHADPLPGK